MVDRFFSFFPPRARSSVFERTTIKLGDRGRGSSSLPPLFVTEEFLYSLDRHPPPSPRCRYRRRRYYNLSRLGFDVRETNRMRAFQGQKRGVCMKKVKKKSGNRTGWSKGWRKDDGRERKGPLTPIRKMAERRDIGNPLLFTRVPGGVRRATRFLHPRILDPLPFRRGVSRGRIYFRQM